MKIFLEKSLSNEQRLICLKKDITKTNETKLSEKTSNDKKTFFVEKGRQIENINFYELFYSGEHKN